VIDLALADGKYRDRRGRVMATEDDDGRRFWRGPYASSWQLRGIPGRRVRAPGSRHWVTVRLGAQRISVPVTADERKAFRAAARRAGARGVSGWLASLVGGSADGGAARIREAGIAAAGFRRR